MTVTTGIILGLIAIGALVGFGAVTYSDYKDDGHAFNGSVKWETYVGGTPLGGLIGYFAAPGIATMLASSGTIGGELALAGIGGSIGGIAVSTAGELALAGAAVLTGIGAFGASVMFSKPNAGRIRFSDGTGIDPLTGKEATKERAYDIYRNLKDPIEKANGKNG